MCVNVTWILFIIHFTGKLELNQEHGFLRKREGEVTDHSSMALLWYVHPSDGQNLHHCQEKVCYFPGTSCPIASPQTSFGVHLSHEK